MALTVSASGFAQKTNDKVSAAASEVANTVKNAPSGTVYGVVERSKDAIVVNTPFGRQKIERRDGGFHFMGMYAKVLSGKNGVYRVKTSLGTFPVNTRKGTVTKDCPGPVDWF